MARYPEDFREQAIRMMEEIGPGKTSAKLHIPNQTLYRWKKEKLAMPTEESITVAEKVSTDNGASGSVSKNAGQISLPGIEAKLKEELNDMRHVNKVAEETIDYLIAENRQLRQRCERYLKALSLLSQ